MKVIGDKLSKFQGRILMDDPLLELWVEMKKLCDAGLSSEEVIAFLHNTRSLCSDESAFARIRELMEIASGRCERQMQIWPIKI